ncbi:cell division-specific peptidoglycan biosynthesis regulator FtsW [Kushneria sinocarnis]|uniref:Probable peptidoglycan glycosyltransferase FtsW n=1 Tax=Kushneria sinocarnis TaxID=595502 RepID=A0A420WVB5_9GAMM|nr:putative lipid II flippase FtsW [Kushneria sinocarnis]RKR02496.1 cell division-specific peptidoglycan biosynthesis regulator FtsW [Kushneria sinocarnis]
MKSNLRLGERSWSERLSTDHHMLDSWLLLPLMALPIIGWIMVTSASTEIASSQTGSPWYFSIRHGVFVFASLIVALAVMRFPVTLWRSNGPALLMLAMILLALVLVVGNEVNGSRRWIPLGPINIQPSEVAKFCMVIYVAGYMERHLTRLRRSWWGFLAPLSITLALGVLLILEPDYGTTVVLLATAMGMLLLAGASLWRFLLLLFAVVALGAFMAISEPYRMQRITGFLDPWANQYGTGYQLTQALIAFGRGGWTGLGLGNSVQKLFFLPEAHTDFVFSVLAEELGVAGSLTVVGLFALLVYRGFRVGRVAEENGQLFAAYVCYGFSLIIGGQAFINIAVNAGILPTKGLTLPLLSYGGSSLLTSGAMAGLLLRVDGENRGRRRASRKRQQHADQEGAS